MTVVRGKSETQWTLCQATRSKVTGEFAETFWQTLALVIKAQREPLNDVKFVGRMDEPTKRSWCEFIKASLSPSYAFCCQGSR